jgi:hypothetical protein
MNLRCATGGYVELKKIVSGRGICDPLEARGPLKLGGGHMN